MARLLVEVGEQHRPLREGERRRRPLRTAFVAIEPIDVAREAAIDVGHVLAGLRAGAMYQTRHSFASNALAAGEPPSWAAAMLGHTTREMLFSVYARYLPNRTRRDGSALLAHMVSNPKNSAPTPD